MAKSYGLGGYSKKRGFYGKRSSVLSVRRPSAKSSTRIMAAAMRAALRTIGGTAGIRAGYSLGKKFTARRLR